MPEQGTLVRVTLNDGNIAPHPIYGPVTRTYYGYRRHGEAFRVHPSDAKMQASSRVWLAANEEPAAPPVEQEPVTPPTTDEETVSPLLSVWGINQERVEMLNRIGIETVEDLLKTDEHSLMPLLGISQTVAKRIMSDAGKSS